jgi:hypothetical protein
MSWKETLIYLGIAAVMVVLELEMTNDHRWVRVKTQTRRLGKDFATWSYQDDRRRTARMLGIPEPSWLG